ncbi:MAG: hypothetical protein AB8E15_12965 [Bdellovibrionales bacterium]
MDLKLKESFIVFIREFGSWLKYLVHEEDNKNWEHYQYCLF